MNADPDPRLEALRDVQIGVLSRLLPDLPRLGAEVSQRDSEFAAQSGGESRGTIVSQRVQVELPGDARVDAASALAALLAASGSGAADAVRRSDRGDALRVDVLGPQHSLHSLALLHGGRVVQLTSFSAAGAEQAPAEHATTSLAPDDERVAALDVEEQIYGRDYGYRLKLAH